MTPPIGKLSDDVRIYFRHRKTKIGTEIGHVTRDSDTTFKVKGQLAGAGAYCGGHPHSLLDNVDKRFQPCFTCDMILVIF